jgi:REP element-mobilizing transposase RayT
VVLRSGEDFEIIFGAQLHHRGAEGISHSHPAAAPVSFSDRYRNKEFWCRGYYVDTVGKNERRIAEHIKNQLKEDELGEQLVIPSANPFTGRK